MAKKGRMTRRRKSQKKSMRKGTRKQQKGGGVLVVLNVRLERNVEMATASRLYASSVSIINRTSSFISYQDMNEA